MRFYFHNKYILPVAWLFLAGLSVVAQTRVGGVVTDTGGAPVAFANVLFSNSTEGTITNENGVFYMESQKDYQEIEISFTGYKTVVLPLKKGNNTGLEIVMEDDYEQLSAVQVFSGKVSKKNNPAVDILKKIWKNKRRNGVNQYRQYQYHKYEKLEFDLNTIDSALINSRIFKDVKFIFEKIDTNSLSGKNYLPIFINEAVYEVYGDNPLKAEREILKGNKNSGFNNNHALIDFIKDLYTPYNVYDNYLNFFSKNFTSPLSTTGVDVYNYVLADSAYIDHKWCYKIVYYPRRKSELTFQGDFWVNDTTWAIKSINLEMTKSANVNWVNDVYIEQDFEVLNDSTFVITRDHFMTNLALRKKEDARGIYGQRTTIYDNYVFDLKKPKDFYKIRREKFDKNIFNREDEFWEEQRLTRLTDKELGIYDMLDTLKKTKTFKHLYNWGSIISSGYVDIGDFDYGPLPSTFGYNDVEGVRLRGGGRTYFSADDMWRIEGFGAYGFNDQKFKYGISAKWMLDPVSRFKILVGHRRDIEQLGASLTNTSDVLGRSLASSSVLSVGSNKTLSNINLTTFGLEISPFENFIIGVEGSHRILKAASPEFDLNFFTDEEHTQMSSVIRDTELTMSLNYMPGRKTTNYGVERLVVNSREYPQFFLKYSKGIEGVFNSNFDYSRLEFYYSQPVYIGGMGRLTSTLELGKTFGAIPLGLLSPVPGNQSLFSIHDTFPLLDYYEFITDTYASLHLEHNFGGRFFSYIPFLRKLNWREIVAFRGVTGSVSDENKALNASTSHPLLRAPSEHVYWSWSAGVGNIFKFFRVDFHFRGNYRNENTRKFGVTGSFEIDF